MKRSTVYPPMSDGNKRVPIERELLGGTATSMPQSCIGTGWTKSPTLASHNKSMGIAMLCSSERGVPKFLYPPHTPRPRRRVCERDIGADGG